MFRGAVRRRRCLVSADGFYGWQQWPGGERGKKQPYFIHRSDDGPFAFAGLCEVWKQETAPPLPIESCTIMTTEANRAYASCINVCRSFWRRATTRRGSIRMWKTPLHYSICWHPVAKMN